MRTLMSVLATAIASFVAVALVPSAHVIGHPQWAAYLAFALMLCVMNAIVKPIIQILSILGTHEQLLEKHGFYYDLYNSQFAVTE